MQLPSASAFGLPAADSAAYKTTGHGVFFLAAKPGGLRGVLPAISGATEWDFDVYIATPANPPAAVREAASRSLPHNNSVLDKIFVELVVVEEAGPPPLLSFELTEEYRANRSPVLAAALSRFAASQNRRLRILGLCGGVLSGDPALILAARQNASALSSDAEWPELMRQIGTHYQNTSRQAIRNLGQVATEVTSSPDLRRAAAAALARMHTRQSLPYLAALLDDPDVYLKAMGVSGLRRLRQQ